VKLEIALALTSKVASDETEGGPERGTGLFTFSLPAVREPIHFLVLHSSQAVNHICSPCT
jgi:hypothetical protein